MAEDFPEIIRGALDTDADVLDAIANGIVAIWEAVVIVAPAAGETLPRVATTTTVGDPAKYGVCVDFTGASVVAGDHISVCVKGRTKVKAVAAIALAALIECAATAGKVQTAALAVIGDVDDILGMALTGTAAADNDLFVADIGRYG